jgi:hypothetical protein
MRPQENCCIFTALQSPAHLPQAEIWHVCAERKDENMRKLAFTLVVAILCVLFPCLVCANPIPIIQYRATNIADSTPGQDLWKYEYFLSYATGDTFLNNQGFTIDFAVGFFTDLLNTTPVLADWLTFVTQPDPNLPDGGEYDALALTDTPSLAGAFGLTFVWHGTGTPGSQPFTVNQFDAQLHFEQIGQGWTQPLDGVIPEPGTVFLLASGLAALAFARRKRT